MTLTCTWLGHSAMAFNVDGNHFVCDPFITDNPKAPIKADQVEAQLILLSHGHFDHLGDTVAIAKRTGATVSSNFEICSWVQRQGVENIHPCNIGGSGDFSFVRVKWTAAVHSSSMPDGTYGGEPSGMLLSVQGKTIYYAGDTGLFSDMSLIGEEGIDIAFLPIGDTFTMGLADSIRAIKMLHPKVVIPMHYNTWPPIEQDTTVWSALVRSKTEATPLVIDPGVVTDLLAALA